MRAPCSDFALPALIGPHQSRPRRNMGSRASRYRAWRCARFDAISDDIYGCRSHVTVSISPTTTGSAIPTIEQLAAVGRDYSRPVRFVVSSPSVPTRQRQSRDPGFASGRRQGRLWSDQARYDRCGLLRLWQLRSGSTDRGCEFRNSPELEAPRCRSHYSLHPAPESLPAHESQRRRTQQAHPLLPTLP